jgi:hypothetical protein
LAQVRAIHAQGAPAHVIVVRIATDPGDAQQLLSRIVELVTPLGVFVRSESAAPGETPLATIEIARADPATLDVVTTARSAEPARRSVPLTSERIDEQAREAVATMCASSVQALLDAEAPPASPEAAPAPQLVPVAVPVPSTTPPPPSAVAPVAPAAASNGTPAASTSREPAPPPSAASGPAGEIGLALGYELFLWGDAHWLHGPRMRGAYVLPAASRLRCGFALEAAITLPDTLQRSAFDVSLFSWRIRALVEPELRVSHAARVTLAVGLSLEQLLAHATAAGSGVRTSDGTQHLVPSLVLRPGLRWDLSPAWSLALGVGVELLPVSIQYGLARPAGFASTVSSGHVRPAASLDLGFTL